MLRGVENRDIQRNPVPESDRFPFGLDFQLSLFRLLLRDSSLAHAVAQHLKPTYFEADPLGWAWQTCLSYREKFGSIPTMGVLREQTRALDPKIRPVYVAMLDRVPDASLQEEGWLRAQVLEFVRRNWFVDAFRKASDLFNRGQQTTAYDSMMRDMERMQSIAWEQVDREWVFEGLPARQSQRLDVEGRGDATTTGLTWLDKILEGGLHVGELGLWIAYPKSGKTTLLVNHGVAATRLAMRNTLHCVFEGDRKQIVSRYDAAFSEELYSHVKTGDMTSEKYEVLQSEYRLLGKKLVVRAFTEEWNYSVLDIHNEIRALKREKNWEPSVVIVDYGDLLRARDKGISGETEIQTSAFRDLKSLANRGYAVWTASQAKRPDKGSEEKAHLIRSRDIADAYAKVRVADFIGSINATVEEKKLKVARLLAEYYRDNEAEQTAVVRADFSRMLIKEEAGLFSPVAEAAKIVRVPRQATVGI